MSNKTTKKALFTSVMSLIICVVMLMGTTFAWFTDSVTSGKNKIMAGNLDVDLLYSEDLVNWKSVDGKADLFDEDALWEPGHTQIVYLKVANLGSLALKYEFAMSFEDTVKGVTENGEEIKLSEHLEYGVIKDVTAVYEERAAAIADVAGKALAEHTEAGVLLKQTESAPFALVVYMPETVGNEANYMTDTAAPQIELGVELFATQQTEESDSFGSDYDNNAPYTTVSDTASILEALTGGEDVIFSGDIAIDPATASNAYGATALNVKAGQTIDGNGHTLDVSGANDTWDSAINTTGGTIKNLTVTGAFRGIFINHNSAESSRVILENVTSIPVAYTISCDQGTNQGLTATDCTFNGWTSYAATLGDAEFINCSFGSNGSYAYMRPYAPTTLTGCTFSEGFAYDASRTTSTFINCYVGNTLITQDNVTELLGSGAANAVIANN